MRYFRWLTWPMLFVLGFFDRDTPLGRLVRFPFAVIVSGLAWPAIALQLHTGDKADKNLLARHCWGMCDPRLRWDMQGSASHKAIDMLVEYVRLSEPQRTAKMGSFVILVWMTLAIAGWLF